MADDLKLDETGINISDTDAQDEKKDVYFTNQDYSGLRSDKKPKPPKRRAAPKPRNSAWAQHICFS